MYEKELVEALAGRNVGDIPLSDPYWGILRKHQQWFDHQKELKNNPNAVPNPPAPAPVVHPIDHAVDKVKSNISDATGIKGKN